MKPGFIGERVKQWSVPHTTELSLDVPLFVERMRGMIADMKEATGLPNDHLVLVISRRTRFCIYSYLKENGYIERSADLNMQMRIESVPIIEDDQFALGEGAIGEVHDMNELLGRE